MSIYHGKWPWKEAQLVAQDPSVSVLTWQHWLQAFMQQEKQSLDSVSLLDAWLLSRYSKLKVQEGGTVFAVKAVSDFTGFRRWKACCVSSAVIYFKRLRI